MKRKLEEKNESKIKKKVSFGDLEIKQYEKRFVWYNLFYAEEYVEKFLNFIPKYVLWDGKYGEAYFNKKEFIGSFDKEKFIVNEDLKKEVYTGIKLYVTHSYEEKREYNQTLKLNNEDSEDNEDAEDNEESYRFDVNVFSHRNSFVYMVDVSEKVGGNQLLQIMAINNENEFLVIGRSLESLFVYDNYTSFHILNPEMELFSEKDSIHDIYKAMNDFERIYELCRENEQIFVCLYKYIPMKFYINNYLTTITINNYTIIKNGKNGRVNRFGYRAENKCSRK
jgi:hypothetical protein